MRNVQREPKLLSAVEDKMEKLKRGLLGGMWVVRKNNNNLRQAQPTANHASFELEAEPTAWVAAVSYPFG